MAKKNRRPSQQLRLPLVLVAILMVGVLFHFMSQKQNVAEEIRYSEFLQQINLPADNPDSIKSVNIQGQEIEGKRADGSTFRTRGPDNTQDLAQQLIERNIEVSYLPPEETSWMRSVVVNIVTFALVLFLLFFILRQLQIGGGKAMSFGKSRARLMSENESKVTFKDVAGVDESKEELEEIIEFLKDPKKFTRLGGRIPKGVLLIGPPGTGKTLLAKAVAGEAGVPFFSISGSDFVEMFVGVGASRVRDLFDQAKKHAPCIVFIDEIDAVGRHRGAGMGGGHDEREQTLNQLLVEMDGFQTNEGVILIAATNRVDVLDPALLRPGRFDRRVVVNTPDLKGREEILKVHTRKTPLAEDVDLRVLAQGTPGFSGADLENLVNEAALIAAREDCSEITNKHFDLAKDKVLMGPARKSMVLGEKEKLQTAYHEAGHAIVAKTIPGNDEVHKITIIPRGMALGVTMLLPSEDQLNVSRDQAEAMLAFMMGGRTAEEIVFGKITTGASDDIRKATEMARKMVCRWGMSDALGPILFDTAHEDPFLGRDWGRQQNYSEKIAVMIDEEVRRIIMTAYERAKEILEEKRDILDHLAEALVIKETVEGAELERAMRGEEIITAEERQRYEEAKKARTHGGGPSSGSKKEITLSEKPSASDEDDEPAVGFNDPLPQGT